MTSGSGASTTGGRLRLSTVDNPEFNEMTNKKLPEDKLLPEEWTRPRIVILDDLEWQVKTLINLLRNMKYDVLYVSQDKHFRDALAEHVYPIQLIDISLAFTGGREGFVEAKYSASQFPDALRILISKNLSNIEAKELVDVVNPAKAEETPLSLPASLGTRAIWALADKEDLEEVRRVIVDYRNTVGCGDNVELWVDEALLHDISEGFAALRWVDVLDPQIQFVEVVRQLARRSSMPTPRRVHLKKLGKGRSKTVVAHMRIEYPVHEDGSSGSSPKHLDSIIKIGRRESIARELRNYKTVVPQIFGSAFYPSLEAKGVSRHVAGVAYSCLSDSDLSIAPTLLDAIYGKVKDLPTKKALSFVRSAFEHLRGKPVWLISTGVNKRVEGLKRCYERRFQELTSKSLSKTLQEGNDCLQQNASMKDGLFRLSEIEFSPAEGIHTLTNQAAWEDFNVCLSHGDLHLDNILLVRQRKSWSNFYIDFADAGEQHVMMDFVVMETAVRFQAIRFLPSVAENRIGPVLNAILSMERAVFDLAEKWSPTEKGLAAPVKNWLLITWSAARAIRLEVRRFVQEDLSKAYLNAEEERYRFYCGLGLSGLAAMHLPQSKHENLHRAWFAYVGQAYLNIFNHWKGQTDVA